jgi:hypothetical protein
VNIQSATHHQISRQNMRQTVTQAVGQKALPSEAAELFDRVPGDTLDSFSSNASSVSAFLRAGGEETVRITDRSSMVTGALAVGLGVAALALTGPLAFGVGVASLLCGAGSVTAAYNGLLGKSDIARAHTLGQVQQLLTCPQNQSMDNPTTLAVM